MEKKNIIKIVLMLVVIVFIIFIAFTLRKLIIISNLNSKISTQIENKNVYAKTDSEKTIIEAYRLDNNNKQVFYNKDNGIKITQISTSTKRLLYTENGEAKIMHEYPGDGENEYFEQNQNIIRNFTRTENLLEKIVFSIRSKITFKEVDGKQCYVISGLYNINFAYEQNTNNVDIFIEKNTGLPVKVVETINDNGNVKEKITTYEYKFDIVTEGDLAELDESQYIKE